MKTLKGSLPAKFLAAILFCALCLSCLFAALGVALPYTYYQYDGVNLDGVREECLSDLLTRYGWRIAESVFPSESAAESNKNLSRSRNLRYEVYDASGALRVSTLDGAPTQAEASYRMENWFSDSFREQNPLWSDEGRLSASDAVNSAELPEPAAAPEGTASAALPTPSGARKGAEPEPTPYPVSMGNPVPVELLEDTRGREELFTVKVYLLRDLRVKDSVYWEIKAVDFLLDNNRAMLPAALGSLLLALLLFLFLMSAAGHRRGTDELKGRFAEKIPFDLFTAAIAAAGILLIFIADQWTYGLFAALTPLSITAALLLFLGCVLLALWWCMSLAVRVKQKTLLKGMLCYKLLRFVFRAVKAVWLWLKMLITGIPLVWRGVLVLCGAEFIGFLILAAGARRAGAVGFFINLFVFFPLALWGLICARRLRLGAEEIARGNTAYRIDTKYLFGEFRRHAEDLNQIQGGISRAVDARLRSEKMKTELITNVSHDIKTPLTSIINYVDLLSREELENEKAREYLEVLQRQSARLKKLTDDLVEASKASSGVLGVTLEDCELGVMLEQTAGEYGERLAEKGLSLVLRKPDKAVHVRADARHTQRIFDNLMSNILKYAMPGTRVYLELTEEETGAAVIFRNTSGREIVLSPEELTERFVRGDAARSTEGSGLGLSIARSLAELQGGSLAVTVDGDLFKVTLNFQQ